MKHIKEVEKQEGLLLCCARDNRHKNVIKNFLQGNAWPWF